jgi:hypothetical protein
MKFKIIVDDKNNVVKFYEWIKEQSWLRQTS